jgi:hypothetical protein
MTADNSILDSVSANSDALEITVATGNLTACDGEAEVTNCSDLGEAAVRSENAIIENVAKVAKLYAAGTPSDEEFKALKAMVVEASTREKLASCRQENLAPTGKPALSRDAWFVLESHVRGRVGPATKVTGRANFPVVLALTVLMGLAGSIYFDDAFGPLRDKVYRMVGAGKTVISMQADGAPGASNDTRRGVNTASSSLPNQSLVSSTRILGSRDGDALQIRGGTIRETNRDVTVEAPDGPKPSSSTASSGGKPSLGAAPPTQFASENSTVVQQHKASIRHRAEDLQLRAKLTPISETRPTTIEGWTLREVINGTAILEGPTGIWKAVRGDNVPGIGKVDSIVLWGNRWIVATSRGLISTP